MQASVEEKLYPDHDMCSEIKMSQDFQARLKLTGDSQDDDVKPEENEARDNLGGEEEETEEEDEAEAEEEEEFSFMCAGDIVSPIAAEDAFINGQIKPVFPFFNRDLMFSGDDSSSLHDNLPARPPVKKVFVEMNEENSRVTSPAPGDDEIAGPYCKWSNSKAVEASKEVCKKSNSTGFSKIWRFKEFVGRCNSDGRDAFVFLNNGQAPRKAERPASATLDEKTTEEESRVKTIRRKVKKSGKSKTAPLSAHEEYLRSKAKEEERRRSYLPYKPELMGFFTNVNGGLTKNVHPF